MSPENHTELLKVLWKETAPAVFETAAGEPVVVRCAGEYDEVKGRYTGAEIVTGDRTLYGEVVFSASQGIGSGSGSGDFQNCILQVVPYESALILKYDGQPITQVVMRADPVVCMAYETLKSGAADFGCARHIARMEDVRRVRLFTRMLTDRMARKCSDLKAIYDRCEQNWNETMYVMLMRTMGDSRNKEAFTQLAHRVGYIAVSRESNSVQNVEALLLGGSGMLEMYDDDSYIRDLKTAFDHLRRKYSITPMLAGEWNISRTNPNNHPVLRLAQMAAFLSSQDFLFDKLVKCGTVDDVHTLLRAEASQYWSTHFIPGSRSGERPKRIGHFKANILGINLVVPMLFAYGEYIGDETFKERAIDLLEKINCEENRYINGWRAGGVPMESAFDSQAMLQLNNEYCLKGLCWNCPVGRHVLRQNLHR